MKVFIVPSLKRKADSPVAKLPSAPGMNVELTMNMFFFERAARVFLEKLAEAIEWCCILLVGFVGVRRSTEKTLPHGLKYGKLFFKKREDFFASLILQGKTRPHC